MDTTPKHIVEVKDPETSKRQISIWLDAYDDIFSDFDPRPYSERTLSDDFIYEVKKVCREDIFEIGELRLLIPSKLHNETDEQVIIKRLHSYFRHGNYYISRRLRKTRIQAIFIALGGLLLLILASYISSLHSEGFLFKVLFVVFEPAGWFFAWTGLDDLFFAARRQRTDLDFFSKMSRAKVVFAAF